jgi:hypothetical protein
LVGVFGVEVEGVEERGGAILVGGVLSVCGGLYGLRPILGRTQVCVCVRQGSILLCLPHVMFCWWGWSQGHFGRKTEFFDGLPNKSSMQFNDLLRLGRFAVSRLVNFGRANGKTLS